MVLVSPEGFLLRVGQEPGWQASGSSTLSLPLLSPLPVLHTHTHTIYSSFAFYFILYIFGDKSLVAEDDLDLIFLQPPGIRHMLP